MMRLWGGLLLAGLALIAGAALLGGGARAIADDKKDDAAKDEMKKLDGNWQLVASEHDGEKAPAEAIKTAKVATKAGKVTMSVDGKTVMEADFTIDPTKKPKTIDATATTGADKGKKTLGIYEFDGDTFKVCYSEKERPTEFSAKKGSGNTLDVYKREKP
jgi:uncharacterized protein (TIGR03067 family)